MNKISSIGTSLLIISLLLAKSIFGSMTNENRFIKSSASHAHSVNFIIESGKTNIFSPTGMLERVYTDLSKLKVSALTVNAADTIRRIKGKVISSEDGQPLAGVSVIVKDSHIPVGTVTNQNGNFSINIPEGIKKVIFSFIGYQTQEVVLSESNAYNISLKSLVKGLSQVVVVAYGKQNLASYTGSVGILKPEAFQKAPREDAIESLQGNVAGVLASNDDGQPGSPVEIEIRGVGSINASTQPLYVVDGVPIETTTGINYGSYGGATTTGLAGINPNDIASITVLKDAAATSIYGSRAANGVVIITTKSGESGKARIHFSVQQGFNKIDIMKRGYPLNTSEMIELLREGWANAGKNSDGFVPALEAAGVDTTQNTNWVKALTRIGAFRQYYLSLSGGNAKTQYFISGGYDNNQSTLGKMQYKRGTAKISLKSQPLKSLSINASVSSYYQETLQSVASNSFAASSTGSIYKMQPWLKIYNADGSYNLGFNLTYNPVAVENLVKLTGTAYNTAGDVGAKLDIFKGLSFETKEHLELTYGETDFFCPAGVAWSRSTDGIGWLQTSIDKSWVTSNLLRFTHDFNHQHLEAFIGYEAQDVLVTGSYTGAQDFIPNLETLSAASTPTNASSTNTESSLAGTFLNAQYNYKQNYFVSASVRRDGSSRFGAQRRYGNFWSVSAGWSIQNTLLKNISWISFLKLRSSYGTNGNQGIGDYAFAPLYGAGYNYNNQAGYVFSQFGNPVLTWEQNAPFDVGVDFGLWGNRLTGTIDYYERTSNRLLLNVPLPATSGLSSYSDNFGSMRNSGFEISLNSKNLISQKKNGLKWATNFNLSTEKNVVLSIPSTIISGDQIHEIGSDYFTWYFPAYAGVDPQTGVALYYSDASRTKTTTNYNEAPALKMGSSLPKFYGGLTNTFEYEHFTLSFLLFINWGNKIYDEHSVSYDSDGSRGFSYSGSLSRYTYDNRWQKPGDKTDIPKIIYLGPVPNYPSSRWLWNGSYVRLRDISLTYSLPAKMIQRIGLQEVDIYARGSDLLSWVPDKHVIYDPETGSNGLVDLNDPINKTLIFGLDINF
ncbi:MAG TPA: SusC/RagA family TonB-linked outer membrane protein [Ginsengibacter sp.]